jgi:hypothetical protein
VTLALGEQASVSQLERVMALRAVATRAAGMAAVRAPVAAAPRRPMSIWSPLVNKKYDVNKKQELFASKS